eukprot:Platyproteum_vivax@DN11993_c0_g1_i1.p1
MEMVSNFESTKQFVRLNAKSSSFKLRLYSRRTEAAIISNQWGYCGLMGSSLDFCLRNDAKLIIVQYGIATPVSSMISSICWHSSTASLTRVRKVFVGENISISFPY